MEYIDFSKYFSQYYPIVKEKEDNTQIDYNSGYSNPLGQLEFTEIPQFSNFETYQRDTRQKLFNDLFDSEDEKPPTQQEMHNHYSGPITDNLSASINKQLNKPYALGGGHDGNLNSKKLDCSGFVSLCFKEAFGVNLNGRARDIYNNKKLVSVSRAQPGDIIFFRGTSSSQPKNVITHVGIITQVDANGNPTKMAHASARQYKKTVEVNYDPNYWNQFRPEIKRLNV